MTTVYLFHPWIEASETENTVVSVFGQWWDGDVSGGSDPESSLVGGKLIRKPLLVRGGPLIGR